MRRRRPIGLAAAAFWTLVLATVPARAGDVAVHLEVRPAQTVPGEPVQATVTVTGAVRGLDVELPAPPGVVVRAAGSSRNVQIINGQVESNQQYLFQVSASAPGTYQLGPAHARRKGNAIVSNTATLTVSAGEEPVDTRTGVFTNVAVSNPRPYVGEQVVYTLRLFRPRTQTLREFRLVEPETDGLWKEAIDADSDRVTTVNNRPYIVNTVQRAYFPTRAGRVTISGAAVTYHELLRPRRRSRPSLFDDSFFDMLNPRSVARRVDVEPVTLEVRPLPEPPDGVAPADVGVGAFTMSATLSADTVRAGESLTLTVRITGEGNLRALPDVTVPDSPSFKAYPDVADVTITTRGPRISGVREQRIALVPQEAGERTVPPVRLVIFNPAEDAWTILTTPEYTVHVTPGESQIPVLMSAERAAPTSGGGAAPQRLATDLLAPHPLPARLRFADTRERLVGTVAGFGAPLLWVVSYLLRRRAAAHAADPTLGRRRHAGKIARAALRGDARGDAGAVAAAVANYVADRIGAAPGAVTGEEAIGIISATDATLAEAAARILRAGDAARYAGGAAAPDTLADDALQLVQALDRRDLHGSAVHA